MDRLRVLPSCTCCLSGYHLPLWAGLGGIFAAYGLQVEVAEPRGRVGSVQAVASGRYDCCLTSVRNFIEAKESTPGLAARYVLMVSRRSHIAAFTRTSERDRWAAGARDFVNLEGATFLRSTDSPYMGAPEYLPLLESLHLSPGPVIDVPYSELYEAMVGGPGRVGVSWLNLLPDLRAAARERGTYVHTFPFHRAGLDVYGSGIVASDRSVHGRPGVLQRFIAALRRALSSVRRDASEALAVFRERYPDRDAGRALEVWNAGEELIFLGGDDEDPDHLGAMDAPTWRTTIEHHARSYGSPSFAPREMFDPTIARTTAASDGGTGSRAPSPERI